MSHTVEAFLAKAEVFAEAAKHLRSAHVIPLAQGYALLPVTDAVAEEAGGDPASKGAEPFSEFWMLTTPLVQLGEQWSHLGKIAYFETDYFGGGGHQAAIVWNRGEVALGPMKGRLGPINRVLRYMGVDRSTSDDEFSALGLQRYRNNEDWIEQPNYGRSPE